MKKPKRKHEAQSTLGYWWNELLFTKHFTLDTSLSARECVDRLERLAYPPKDDGRMTSRHVDIKRVNEIAQEFEVYSQQGSRKSRSITAHVSGAIATLGTQTHVQGEAKIGLVILLQLMVGLVIGIWQWTNIVTLVISMLWIGYVLRFVWWPAITSRNQLINDIEAALNTEKGEHDGEAKRETPTAITH